MDECEETYCIKLTDHKEQENITKVTMVGGAQYPTNSTPQTQDSDYVGPSWWKPKMGVDWQTPSGAAYKTPGVINVFLKETGFCGVTIFKPGDA